MNHLEEKAYIFGTIFTLSNRLQLLGDRMDPELTVKQWLFLVGVLRCGSAAPTLSEIAAYIGSSRQNVKKMALILNKQGFVSMEKDALDARALRIRLTEACKDHLKRRERLEFDFIEELFTGFAPQELSALADAVQRLEKNGNNMGRKYEEKGV
jgi:DNA-binding MarR family transcriptional regulator